MGDVGDIETSGSDCSGNEDGCPTSSECLQSSFSLALRSVTVDRGGVVSLCAEEVTKGIGHSLGLDENENETARLFSEEEVEEERLLVVVVDVFNSLGDVLRSRTDSADREEDVVLEEGSSEHLNLTRECSGEHKGLSFLHSRHVFTFDDSSNLGLETHIQHSISLIEDEVLDVGETDSASLDKVDKSTGGGREEITSSVESSDLLANVGSSVYDGRSDP